MPSAPQHGGTGGDDLDIALRLGDAEQLDAGLVKLAQPAFCGRS